jgi:hypothetical protein
MLRRLGPPAGALPDDRAAGAFVGLPGTAPERLGAPVQGGPMRHTSHPHDSWISRMWHWFGHQPDDRRPFSLP